jgi:hypothetical protein
MPWYEVQLTPAHARGWEHSLSSGPPASEEDG